MIDTNVVTVQQLGRGAADLCDIPKFLLERVFAYEAVLSPDDARAATCVCQLEMIRSGTTCFADSGSRFPEIVADAAVETGLRAMVPRACYDEYDTFMGSFPAVFARESTEETCRHAVSAIAAVRDVCCDRIQAAVALPWLAAASDALCNEMAKIAQAENVRVIAAAGRSRDDAVASRRQHSCTEVGRLLKAGLLSPTSIIAHAGWTSPDDLAAIKDNDAVACCPSTSHRLGTGSLEFGRYPELLAFGVNSKARPHIRHKTSRSNGHAPQDGVRPALAMPSTATTIDYRVIAPGGALLATLGNSTHIGSMNASRA